MCSKPGPIVVSVEPLGSAATSGDEPDALADDDFGSAGALDSSSTLTRGAADDEWRDWQAGIRKHNEALAAMATNAIMDRDMFI